MGHDGKGALKKIDLAMQLLAITGEPAMRDENGKKVPLDLRFVLVLVCGGTAQGDEKLSHEERFKLGRMAARLRGTRQQHVALNDEQRQMVKDRAAKVLTENFLLYQVTNAVDGVTSNEEEFPEE